MLKRRIAFLPLMVLAAAGTAVTQGIAVGAVGAAEPGADIEVRTEEEAALSNRMGNAIREDMDDRAEQQAARDEALTLRERAIAAAEKRLSDDLAEDQTVGSVPAEPEVNQFDSLARIYQTMKPKRAAAIFEQLELRVQVEVASRMRERSVALIIAYMNPERAAMLTMALAEPEMIPATAAAADREEPAG